MPSLFFGALGGTGDLKASPLRPPALDPEPGWWIKWGLCAILIVDQALEVNPLGPTQNSILSSTQDLEPKRKRDNSLKW